MDPATKASKLYKKVDAEISLFIGAYAAYLQSHAVMKQEMKGRAERHMARTLSHARKVGGKLLKDVETLNRDFRFFLSRPTEKINAEKVLKDAIRIKHEVILL